jgi:chorismate dehydratase
MQRVRLAAVRYLNTAPLIEGLDACEDIELTTTVPSRIAELVTRDDADLGLASIIDAARAEGELTMLPVGQIGCDGPTLTVRLFSSVPFERIETFAADTDSHTSVALARILLKRLFRADALPRPFDARERVLTAPGSPVGASLDDWPASLLLIGDKVVTDPPPADRYPYHLDLGQAWHELTGLPFVYATWMCRERDLADPQRRARIHAAASILDRQRRRNAERMHWIVSRRSAQARWPVPLAVDYLTRLLRYETGPREREAAERFFAEASALDLCPRVHAQWAQPC